MSPSKERDRLAPLWGTQGVYVLVGCMHLWGGAMEAYRVCGVGCMYLWGGVYVRHTGVRTCGGGF